MSGQAALEISNLIRDSKLKVDQIASDSVQNSNQVVKNVENISTSSRSSLEFSFSVLQKVSGSVQSLSSRLNEFLTATKEQVEGISQVDSALSKLSNEGREVHSASSVILELSNSIELKVKKFNDVSSEISKVIEGKKAA
jgi:methyl-accepting chemotaxis protein